MADQVPPAELSVPPAWALARVPGLEDGREPLRLIRLEGGSINQVFRVDSLQGRFVVRLDGPQWRRPGVDRSRELLLHRCAAASGFAPAVVAEAQGLLILDYLEGEIWTAAQCAQLAPLRLLAERLASLHAVTPPTLPPFEPLAIAQAYAQAIAPTTPLYGQATALLQRLATICGQLAIARRPLAIVHGDLAHVNLLLQNLSGGARLWMLDWEYAQLADPLMDVACLRAYYPGARIHDALLLAAAGFEPAAVAQELALRTYVYEALTWLWHGARGEARPLPEPAGG